MIERLKQSLAKYPAGSSEHTAILELIESLTPAVIAPKPDPSTMTRTELLAEYRELRSLKAWNDRYFALDREIQSRATREWVHDDVFGNTFAPLNTDPN